MDNDTASEQELSESTDSEDDSKDAVSESLSDIDDVEVGSYLNNEKEKHYKKIIWEMMNEKYLKEKEAKGAAATSNDANSKRRPHSKINDMQSENSEEPSSTGNPKKRRVGEKSIGTPVEGATDEYEDDENGWEDVTNFSHYNNQEEEYNYYDDDDDLF